MGYSTTSAYRIETTQTGGHLTPMAWEAKFMGKPTAQNLALRIASLNESFAPGGCNFHPTARQIVVKSAKLVRQASGEVVAEWSADAPMFEVIN